MFGTKLMGIDLIVIIGYLVVVVIIGLLFVRRGSKSIEAFFVSGRGLPWWLAGTSLVATTFACDTPLWVTDIVRRFGIQFAWLEWAPVWGLGVTLFITGRLLRKSALVTDIQLAQTRYGGKSGSFLRIYAGSYYAVLFNTMVLGWVLFAMGTWGEEVLGISKYTAVIGAAALALLYASASGLWGVVVTDLLQFIVATGGAVTLAILSIKHVGGLDAMVSQLSDLRSWEGHQLNVLPRPGLRLMPQEGMNMTLTLVCMIFGLQWMLGANPLIFSAQRVLACKSDRDMSLALIWNSLARHVLNIWPWVIVAVCSLLVFPNLADHQEAYPKMVTTVLPAGLRGLMMAAILAAFMSSVDTLLNWASSYVVNDIYQPYLVKEASERHYVWISRLSMVIMAAVGAYLGLTFTSIIEQLQFVGGMLVAFAPVMVLRWFWWRINAWSEVSAITAAAVSSFVISKFAVVKLGQEWGGPPYFGHRVIPTILFTTIVWVIVTLLTKPSNMETLKVFYRRVRPVGFWGPVRASFGPGELPEKPWLRWPQLIFGVVACAAMIYAADIAVGKYLLGSWGQGIVFTAICVAAFAYIYRKLGQLDRMETQEPAAAQRVSDEPVD